MPNGERDTEKDKNFWLWVERTYAPEQVAVIQRDVSVLGTIWEHYVTRIYGTQWDIGYEPMPRGRPQPEKYGLNESDWLVLEMLGGNPARVQGELEKWIGTDYINQFQARDIWDELNVRLRQAATTLLATGYTEEEWPAEYERRQTEKARLKEEERVRGQYRIQSMVGSRFAARPAPFTEYGPALEEMRAGFAETMPKTERWRDWFRSKYPRMIEQFEAKPEIRRTEKGWAEYLKKRKPEIREEWYGMTPYQRGERPSAFAPRIQTVKF